MDKTLSIKLNGNRRVRGVLRGFDQFMNITLEDSIEEVSATEQNKIGMVVSCKRANTKKFLTSYRSFEEIALFNLNVWIDYNKYHKSQICFIFPVKFHGKR